MKQKNSNESIIKQEEIIVDEAEKLKDTIEKKYPTKKPISKYLAQVGISIAIVVALIIFAGTKYQVKTEDSSLNLNGEQIISFADGTYTGILKDGLGDDFGTYEFNTGVTYTGNWSNGQYTGQGQMVYPGIGEYKGDYSNGVRSGTGTFTWEDGTVYTGGWFKDQISGKGTIDYPNGLSLTGSFLENKFSDVEYQVSGDNYSGKLILRANGMRAEITIGGLSYAGPIDENGTLTGRSSITYPNGDSYSGYVLEGKKVEGMYKFKNGDKFDGTFENDKMCKGTYTFSTGQTLTGTFENGLPEGTMTYTVNSTKYTTTWNNGKCTKITK